MYDLTHLCAHLHFLVLHCTLSLISWIVVSVFADVCRACASWQPLVARATGKSVKDDTF